MSQKTTYATVPLKDHQGLLVKVSYYTYNYCYCTLLKYRTKEAKQYIYRYFLSWPWFLPRKAVIFVDRVSFVQVREGDNSFYLEDKVEMHFTTFYVLKAKIMYFIRRCWYLNCSVQRPVWMGGSEYRMLLYVTEAHIKYLYFMWRCWFLSCSEF